MDPKSHPGGKPVGAAGAKQAAVLINHMAVQIGDLRKSLSAIRAPVYGCGVQIQLGFGGKYQGSVRARLWKPDHEKID